MKFAANKILPILFCTLTLCSIAQNEFSTFTKSDGLTSSTILFTYVDSQGIVWAATKEGVNAFTGKEWIPIEAIVGEDGNEKSLGKVLKIFEASNMNLWIATDKGLFLFNREYWTCFSDADDKAFSVKFLFEDRDGNIWVLSEKITGMKEVSELGFYLVEGTMQMFNGLQWFEFTSVTGGAAAVAIGEPSEYFTSIIQAKNGDVWVTSLEGIYSYDGVYWNDYDVELLPSNRCYQVIETSENEIWVATAKGMAKKNGDKWIEYKDIKGFRENLPYLMLEDSQNRIWTLTRRGHRFKSACCFENGKWKSFSDRDMDLKGNMIQLREFNSEILAYSDKGMSLFKGAKWRSLSHLFNIKEDIFFESVDQNDNSIIIATGHNIFKFTSDSLKKISTSATEWKVTSLMESTGGETWIGTEKDGLFKLKGQTQKNYTTENGLLDDNIGFVFEDKRNNIWVVTKRGISLFNINN